MDLDAHRADLHRRRQRVWPDAVPREVGYPEGEVAITEHLRIWARRTPDRAAIVFYGREITYGELDELSDRFAGWLESVGVGPGDRVGVLLPNCPQFVVAMLGILKRGAVHVPVNPLFREHELTHELTDAGVEVLVAVDTLVPLVEAVRPRTAVREVLVTSLADMLPEHPALPVPDALRGGGAASTWSRVLGSPRAQPREADLDALAALNYTGGTTGMPKGCEHTQRHMLYTAVTAAAASEVGAAFGSGGDDVFLVYVPIFWIAGEDFGILVPLVVGATVVLLTRWDPAAVLAGIERYRVTSMIGTVDNYVELMEHPDFGERDLSSLRQPRAMSFVRKLTVDIRRRWQRAVGEHSVLREGSYGMTETHTADSIVSGFQDGDHDLLAEPVFCGLPVPGTEFLIVDEGSGEPLPVGERGEILVRSPSLLTGYWRNPEATARALRDGWLHTGDVGFLDDDGCLHFLGRNKEMIKVNGMSVFPSEVEALLTRHGDVLTAAVAPLSDPAKGQVPLAFVQPVDGADIDVAELTAWARQNMAPYKVPRFQVVEAMPMTTTGKIKKGELLDVAHRLAAGAAS
ncbi:AMP-binding protein [Pseudonocardia nigra]|uniref:AMP-binding protein n=1 Tax=Pseudonocardia nigra TaxID=1921578 RepID=UPI001C5F6D1E|nr:AMP-binding protein [Pseudonocardia nigra]